MTARGGSAALVAAGLAALVLVSLPPAAPGDGTSPPRPYAAPAAAPASAAARAGGPPPAPGSPAHAGSPFLPFGPKQLPGSALGHPYPGGYINAGATRAVLTSRLQAARAAGARVIVKLPQSRELLTGRDGRFSLDRWKADIDRLRGFDFAPYVADGTVIGAELVNEPNDPANWGGVALTKAEFDGAGAYAKSIWPTLPVGGGRSDYLLALAPWAHIDFGHSQYHMRKGDIDQWIARTVDESRRAGVALLLSLNYSAGGPDNRPLTADQLDRFYSALVRVPEACAVTGYVYDAAYLADPAVSRVMAALSVAARSRSAPPCFVGSQVRP